jgi:glycosyltransferase involved in cell wall biosynthesis
MPAISVIIGVYNRPQLLQRAAESVLGQSFQDLELIVVDDGSTVDLPAQVPALSQPRVRFIRQQNQGVGGARNTGIAASNGELIGFLDSDDILLPQALEVLQRQLQCDPEADIVHGWALTVDEAGRAVQWQRPRLRGLAFRQFLIANQAPIGTQLARRACFEVEKFDTHSFFEDWDLWLRLAFRHTFTYVPKVVAHIHSEPIRLLTSGPATRAAEAVRAMYAKLERDPVARQYVASRRRELEANVHVVAGHHHRVFGHNAAAARREFVRALQIAPMYQPAYVGLAEALLGRQFSDGLRAIRSIIYARGQSRLPPPA